MQNAVGLIDFQPGGLPCFVGHIGLQEFQELHRQLVQQVTGFSRQAEATLLHVPLQCSQMDLNQLVTWILNEWQSIQGGIWSSSANTGINVSYLQQSKLMVKKLCNYAIYHDIHHDTSWYTSWYIS
jgi:hypothetical protein